MTVKLNNSMKKNYGFININDFDVLISINCASWLSALPSIKFICRQAFFVSLSASNLNSQKKLPKGEVSIVLTNNKFIQKLNKKYKNLDQPTNVLAFPSNILLEDFFERVNHTERTAPKVLGDIVVAFETAIFDG